MLRNEILVTHLSSRLFRYIRTMKRPKNPFTLTGYYGKEYFCDRESELEQLREHISNDRNLVIYAWRRLGKSALIKHFFADAENTKEYETVYVDLMATHNMDQAIQAIITAVYHRFGKINTGFTSAFQQLLAGIGLTISYDPVTGLPSFSLKRVATTRDEGPTLEKIGAFLVKRKKTIILALDEFQQISRYDQQQAEAVFRSFMQAFPQIRFIFSGSHRQMMTAMFTESNRPFYQSCRLMSLDAIALESYTSFIEHHFKRSGKTISRELIAAIYEWSRGQTYTVQLLCNMLYARSGPPDLEMLNDVKRIVLQQEGPIFNQLTQLLTKNQLRLLVAIAKDGFVEYPQSKAFIDRHELGAASTVGSALKTMVDRELVAYENTGYFVHEVLFARWMQELY